MVFKYKNYLRIASHTLTSELDIHSTCPMYILHNSVFLKTKTVFQNHNTRLILIFRHIKDPHTLNYA